MYSYAEENGVRRTAKWTGKGGTLRLATLFPLPLGLQSIPFCTIILKMMYAVMSFSKISCLALAFIGSSL